MLIHCTVCKPYWNRYFSIISTEYDINRTCG